MRDYISRETAIKAAEHAYDEWNLAMAIADGPRQIALVYKRQELAKAVASVFKTAPAADVKPVVHGRWKPITNAHGDIEGWICACGRESKEMSKYCPDCGAKMAEDTV